MPLPLGRFLTAWLLLIAAATAQDIRTSHTLSGHAPRVEDERELVLVANRAFAAAIDPQTRSPVWVAYAATRDDFSREAAPSRRWRTSHADVSIEMAEYVHSGYDRGHLVPRMLFDADARSLEEVDQSLAIAPQTPDLNRRTWARIEHSIRATLSRDPSLTAYVVCGALHLRPMKSLPNARAPHRVPSHYWLVLSYSSRTSRGPPATKAYLIPQSLDRGDDPATYETTVSEIERHAGLRL